MFAFDTLARRRVLWAAALVAPVVVVQAVRLMDAGGPSEAPAAVNTDVSTLPETPGSAVSKITEAQRRALAAAAGYSAPERLASPMDHVEPPPAEPPTPEPVTEPVAPEPDPLAGLSVTVIMGRDAAVCAIIGHQVRRLGDEVAPGWRVTAIDPRERTVSVSNAAGDTATLSPRVH